MANELVLNSGQEQVDWVVNKAYKYLLLFLQVTTLTQFVYRINYVYTEGLQCLYDDNYYSLKEVSKLLKVSNAIVRRRIKTGEIKAELMQGSMDNNIFFQRINLIMPIK